MPRMSQEVKEWFDMPDDPDKGRIEVKYIEIGEAQDIEESIGFYQTVLRPDSDGVMRREVAVNPPKGEKRYAFMCAAVTNWENFFDLEGSPMACTDENKIRYARQDKEFSPFVGQCRGKLAEKVAQAREAERKNLNP